jgi:hypothetical protein
MIVVVRQFALLVALLSILSIDAATVEARSSRSPHNAPTDVAPPATSTAATPAPAAKQCPAPCITYRNTGCQTVCCGSAPPIKTTLQVKDPCTCCPLNVSVCVPACCTGTPCVSEARGFLGRQVVWYDWECGFSVKIAFKHSGDVIVTYVNR